MNPFQKARGAELNYARQLKGVAREVGKIVRNYNPKNLHDVAKLKDVLARYAAKIRPWAGAKAATMIAAAERQDKRAWRVATEKLSKGIREEVQNSPVSARINELMAEQVTLITSIPLEAAERVHKLVTENLATQGRGENIEKEILRAGEVSESRAKLIARTEVARAGAVLTQARAEWVGSEGYIWRTVHDSDVRPSHKKMEGTFVKWSAPPTLDGMTGHAGCLPNCRCFAEPVIPNR